MSAHLATLLPCLLPVLVATAQDEQAALSAGPASQLVIKGERHTGTNFLHEIVALNLGERACPGHRGSQCADPCRAHCASAALFKTAGDEQFKKEAAPESVGLLAQCCWKHGYADAGCGASYAADAAFVLLVRSPYPWALAMQQNGYGLKVNGSSMGLELSLRDFLRLPATDDDWHILDSWGPRQKNGIPAEETGGCPSDAHANVLQLWNAKVASYLALARSGEHGPLAVNLTSEQLYDLGPVRRALGRLTASGRYALERGATSASYPEFADIDFKMQGKFSKSAFSEAAAYERERAWLELLSQEDLDWINSQVDEKLMAAFGLERVTRALPHAAAPGESPAQPSPSASQTVAARRVNKDREWHARMLTFLDDLDD